MMRILFVSVVANSKWHVVVSGCPAFFTTLYIFQDVEVRHFINDSGVTSTTPISFFVENQFLPLRYSSIAFAAVLPAPIAEITVAAPVTASPPA